MYELIEDHYIKNHKRLVTLMSNRAGGRPNAEDIVQEAFTRAITFHKSFDPNQQEIGAWFNTILNNALRTSKRTEKLMGMSVEYTDDMDEEVEFSDWEENMIAKIKKDLAKETEIRRQVLQLYLFSQYKPREITQVLDVSNGYVRTLVKEFKKKMKLKYGGVIWNMK
jgi:RNA polymerase sigma factor (sigma-70 family)